MEFEPNGLQVLLILAGLWASWEIGRHVHRLPDMLKWLWKLRVRATDTHLVIEYDPEPARKAIKEAIYGSALDENCGTCQEWQWRSPNDMCAHLDWHKADEEYARWDKEYRDERNQYRGRPAYYEEGEQKKLENLFVQVADRASEDGDDLPRRVRNG